MWLWSINLAYSSWLHYNNFYHVNIYKYAFNKSHIYKFNQFFVISEQLIHFWLNKIQNGAKLSIYGSWTMPLVKNHIRTIFFVCQDKRDWNKYKYLSLWMILKQYVKSLLIVSYSNSEWAMLPLFIYPNLEIDYGSEPNSWNQCILVWSGLVTFVVQFWFETVPNQTMATPSPLWIICYKWSRWFCVTHSTILYPVISKDPHHNQVWDSYFQVSNTCYPTFNTLLAIRKGFSHEVIWPAYEITLFSPSISSKW